MKTKILLLLTAILPLSACNDWLTLTPHGKVEAKELLKNTRGYDSALGGVYYILSKEMMYGKELSYGMMDMLAQYWYVSDYTTHEYYKLSKYDYADSGSISWFNAIWRNFYLAIAECNLILESLEHNRGDIEYAELIEGEALGLRAFCHMELFRMFGPVIHTAADLEKVSVAYRTDFDAIAREFESGRSILDKARIDLLAALKLLENDPIIKNGRKADGNSNVMQYLNFLNRRGSRINYYGVLGLLARLEQSALNPEEAYKYCTRIITEIANTPDMGLIDKDNIENSVDSWKDLNYSKEMLFSLYTNNLYEMTDIAFDMNNKGDLTTSFRITSALYMTFTNEIYGRTPDGSGTDNRLRYWLERNSANRYDMAKLRKAPNPSHLPIPYLPEVPVMRISEVYYIACECQIGRDNSSALKYLNDVRKTRNLADLRGPYSDEMMLEFLVREQRKDFIAEGRMFPLYKRLFRSIYVKAGVTKEPNEKMFVFPIPDDEYEYSPNVKPTN